MSFLLEGLGWLGAFLVLSAYGLLSAKKIEGNTYAYHGLNISGSLCLAIYAFWKHAGAGVLVNVIWMGIGMSAVVVMWRARR